MGSIFTPIQAIIKASAASVACFKIIDSPKSKSGGLRSPDVNAEQNIVFDNVRFTYPSRPESEVLKGVNFEIQGGHMTALVGTSGSGKSTIVALLERWYDPCNVNETPANSQIGVHQETEKDVVEKNPEEPTSLNAGRIRVGEHDLNNVDRKWWRSQIGLVQQEPFLFNETIFENLEKGLVGSEWENATHEAKQELIREACEEALVAQFIESLPEKYETIVGESGIKLSGGQRQRLAIARSIIKKPKILILDEATSSIDVRSEQLVTAALEHASRGRTTIVIAHRLSTIQRADHIVVLKNGVVTEQGTHQSLTARVGGLYAELVQSASLEIGDSTDEPDTSIQTLDPKKMDLVEQQTSQHNPLKTVAAKAKVAISLKSVVKLLYEQSRYYHLYFLTLAGAIGAGAALPIQAWLFSHIITVFQETDISRLLQDGNFWSLMLFVLALCAAISYAVIGYFSTKVSFRVGTAYRKSYFNSVLTKPVSWFDEEGRSFGTLTGQLGSDPQQLQELLGASMAFPLIAVFNLIGSTILSFVFGWKLSLVIFFASLPVILVAAFLRIRYEMSFEATNTQVFAESSKFATETITSFRTVTALTLEDAISTKFQKLLNKQIHDAFIKARFTYLVFALSDSLEFCSMALGFWYGGQLLARREYEPLQFFVIYAALIQGAQAAGRFLAYGSNVANATAAADRIIAYREGSELVSSAKRNAGDDTGSGCKVEFRNVGFQYRTRNISVYENLSFVIEPGQYVAFVGPSGCGKTTIISLLERFYDVDRGTILIDDLEISATSLSQHRTMCGLVSQEPTLFDGTVRENLVLGLPSGSNTPQTTIDAACKAAEIFDFVASLPQGFDTPLAAGTHSSVSGGQKQRLCIARALLRNPQLLLLDEATNSLDSVSEGLIQRAIEQLGSGRSMTIIAVAHRLATVQRADRIFVMGEGGVIIEDGTHQELIQRKGVYLEMCRAQALDRSEVGQENVSIDR